MMLQEQQERHYEHGRQRYQHAEMGSVVRKARIEQGIEGDDRKRKHRHHGEIRHPGIVRTVGGGFRRGRESLSDDGYSGEEREGSGIRNVVPATGEIYVSLDGSV